MGSSCYDEPNLGSDKTTTSSTSSRNNSRKGRRKSNNSSAEKPKQPRRGLGVAQLEKIRLHNQMGYTSSYLPPPPLHNHHHPLSHNNNSQEYMIRQTPYSSSSSFVDSPPSSSSYGFSGNPPVDQMGLSYLDDHLHTHLTTRWPHGNVFQGEDTQQFTQPIITRQLLEQEIEGGGSLERRRHKVRNNGSMQVSTTSNHHNSESSNGNLQDLDLDLRLSL